MAQLKPSTPEISEGDHRLFIHVKYIETIGSIVHTLIKYGAILGIAAFCYLSLNALAGRYTLAQIRIATMADFRISELLAYAFGIGGITYGRKQKKLRTDVISRYASARAEQEKALNPQRGSSELMPGGQTRPEDK